MIIWGTRLRSKVLGQTRYVCQQCHQNSFHTVVRSQRWFTLFFIPIFPFRKLYSSRCNMCGVQLRVPNERAEALFATPTNQPQPLAAVPVQPVAPQIPQAPTAPTAPSSYYEEQLKQQ